MKRKREHNYDSMRSSDRPWSWAMHVETGSRVRVSLICFYWIFYWMVKQPLLYLVTEASLLCLLICICLISYPASFMP